MISPSERTKGGRAVNLPAPGAMDRARSLVGLEARELDQGGAGVVPERGAVAKALPTSLAAPGPDLGVGDLAGDSEWVRRG